MADDKPRPPSNHETEGKAKARARLVNAAAVQPADLEAVRRARAAAKPANLDAVRAASAAAKPVQDQQPTPPAGGGGGDDKVEELIIDPKNSWEMAQRFRHREFMSGILPTLYFWRDQFFHWQGGHYRVIREQYMRDLTYPFLAASKRKGDGRRSVVPVTPNPRLVSALIDGLKSCCPLPEATEAPCWLDYDQNRPPMSEFVAVANGLVHAPTQELWPPTPAFFATAVSPIAYDPEAARPQAWLKFIEDVLPGDPQAQSTLQEYMGYCLTGETRYQKILFIVGPPRSGKGTIQHVLEAIVGRESVAATSFSSLADRFGKAGLIGKTVAILGDARLGTSPDRAEVTEWLLKIAGEDTVNIDRKNLEQWKGRLATRLVIMANELPNLPDSAGGLVDRFLFITMEQSFVGREDYDLKRKLMAELPGILAWAIEGLDRLIRRDRFVLPESSKEVVSSMREITSPISSFIEDCLLTGDEYSESFPDLYEAYKAYRKREGYDRPVPKPRFGQELHTALPRVKRVQRRVGGRMDERRSFVALKPGWRASELPI